MRDSDSRPKHRTTPGDSAPLINTNKHYRPNNNNRDTVHGADIVIKVIVRVRTVNLMNVVRIDPLDIG